MASQEVSIEETAIEWPLNLAGYEEAARKLLPPHIFDYFAGGSGDEETLRANREAFRGWRLLPRALRGVKDPDLSTTVLGIEIALPVLLAPTGYQRLAHDEGEKASARAARDAGTIFMLATSSTYPMEEVAGHAGAWCFQLYMYRDRELTRDLVRRAEEAGAQALVVTVDTPTVGRREADQRNQFGLPPGITWANLTRESYGLQTSLSDGGTIAQFVMRNLLSLSWDDLDWLASITKLPVIPEGILHPDDARIAVEHGARALIVSNHGGRQLDAAAATLDVLPAVVHEVGDRAVVMIDGGIRRGTDVLKALALGAKAVLIGRPYVYGLAMAGEAGVRRVLQQLRDELLVDLVLCGCHAVTDIDATLIARAGPIWTNPALPHNQRPTTNDY